MSLRRRTQLLAPGRSEAHALHGAAAAAVRVIGVLSVGRRARARALARVLPTLPRPERVIDFGCGRGLHTILIAEEFPASEVIGVDVDEESLRFARLCADASGLTNVTFVKAESAAALDFSPADLVVSVDVLEHVRDDRSVINALAERVKPGGTLVLHVPLAGQRYFIRSVRDAQRAEVERGEGPHFREGYTPNELSMILGPRFERLEIVGTLRGPVAFAADLEACAARRRSAWLRILLLPFLLLMSSFDVGGRSSKGVMLIGRTRRPE